MDYGELLYSSSLLNLTEYLMLQQIHYYYLVGIYPYQHLIYVLLLETKNKLLKNKAFKNMDMDGSGFINRSEFEGALKNLNVQLKKPVLDSLLDIIDVEDDDDGGDDHDIGFREFARVMTAADLFKMKALAPRPTSTTVDVREKARRDALQHLRPGVMQEELRKLHEQVRSRITAKYGKHSFSSAFKWIDADRTGSITREEFKEALKQLNLAGVREPILDTLCDFIDQDNSGAMGFREFAQVLSADDVMQWAPSNCKKA